MLFRFLSWAIGYHLHDWTKWHEVFELWRQNPEWLGSAPSKAKIGSIQTRACNSCGLSEYIKKEWR